MYFRHRSVYKINYRPALIIMYVCGGKTVLRFTNLEDPLHIRTTIEPPPNHHRTTEPTGARRHAVSLQRLPSCVDACARERPFSVSARGGEVTVVRLQRAFVDVCNAQTIPKHSWLRLTTAASNLIC